MANKRIFSAKERERAGWRAGWLIFTGSSLRLPYPASRVSPGAPQGLVSARLGLVPSQLGLDPWHYPPLLATSSWECLGFAAEFAARCLGNRVFRKRCANFDSSRILGDSGNTFLLWLARFLIQGLKAVNRTDLLNEMGSNETVPN